MNVGKAILTLVFWGISVSIASGQYCMTTVAGTGTSGFSGGGGAATAANLSNTYYVFHDRMGQYYIAHPNGVRMVDAAGIIHDIAGTGTVGYSGDGGPATAALLKNPQGVTKDLAGNIYITEDGNHVIRKIAPSGIITTICGNGTMGYAGDGGLATAAVITSPRGITTDRNGNIYFADLANHCVRKINSAGIISTIAGTGSAGFSGDGGPATLAQLYGCSDVSVDTFGNIYIADASNNRIRKINSSGIITTVAGSISPGYSGDGGPATLARISPSGITVDDKGQLFIADVNNHRIRLVNTAGIINTIAGNGTAGYSDDICNAPNAKMYRPGKVALDTTGHVYIADIVNLRVRKLTPNFIPFLSAGAIQTLYLCKNAPAYSLDSWLAVTDTNTGQGLYWSVLMAPSHGTCAGTFSTTITSSATTPSGLSYTPAPGYSGHDTCRLTVSDCAGASDTMTAYIYVYDPANGAGTLTGMDSVCIGSSTSITSSVPGGTWFAAGTNVSISAGIASGISAGPDTVYYVVSNSCLADTTEHRIEVKACVGSATLHADENNMALSLWPNPATNELQLQLNTTGTPAHLAILTLTGTTVQQLVLPPGKPTTVPLHLPAGMYLVVAETEQGRLVKKLMVE